MTREQHRTVTDDGVGITWYRVVELQLVRGDHLSALRDPAFTEALVEHVGPR